MKIELKIDNIYEDGEEITTRAGTDVPAPGEGEELLDAWAEEHLLPLTGTGKAEGDAGYFVTITACDERPDLVGREFAYGI